MRYVILLMLAAAFTASGDDKYQSKVLGVWTNKSVIFSLAKTDFNGNSPVAQRRALDLLAELAHAGNTEAARLVGAYYLRHESSNPELAEKFYLLGANLGEPGCMVGYAECRLNRQDANGAAIWLERAVAKGSASAKARLGRLLISGKEIPANRQRGLRLIEESGSYTLLALHTQEPVAKYKWLRIAQLVGQDVSTELRIASAKLTTAQLTNAEALAVAYWKKLPIQ